MKKSLILLMEVCYSYFGLKRKKLLCYGKNVHHSAE